MMLAESLVDLSTVDLVIFLGSLVLVMAVGLLAARHERSAADYFLAGRRVRWWAVAGSIFGSNVSSHHLVGMTGLGLSAGFATANYEFGAVAGLMVLCFLFLPIYRRLGVFTLSEYLEHRFDRRSLVIYSFIMIANLVIFEMVATLFIGSRAMEMLFGIPYRWGILIVAVVTGIYTILGGLKAVIWTDVIQSLLLLIGGCTVAWFALSHEVVGGLTGLLDRDPKKFHVFFGLRDPSLPWLGVLTGLMIMHFHYWGANQFIVQRALGARSVWDGRTGIITAGFFKMMLPFFTVAAGMAANHLLKAGVLPPLPLKDGRQHDDMIFVHMMRHLLPTGLVGLALAGLIGAILSTVDSMMNSAATLFTFDFYKRSIHPGASDRALILAGRIAIAVVLVIAGLVTAYAYDPQGSFFLDLGNRQSFAMIGLFVAFLVGISWKGATRTAAFAVMLIGPVVSGLVTLTWNVVVVRWPWLEATISIADESGQTLLGENGLPQLNWFYRTIVAFGACTVLLVVLSHLTRRERRPEDTGLVWSGGTDAQTRLDRAGRPRWQDERIWAGVLIAVDVVLCCKFA